MNARPAPVRLAMVGAGLIGRAHLARIKAAAECELVALVDPAPAAAQVASEAGVPLFTGIRAMLSAVRPDGVILATPNALHVDGALACIAARVPVQWQRRDDTLPETLQPTQTVPTGFCRLPPPGPAIPVTAIETLALPWQTAPSAMPAPPRH